MFKNRYEAAELLAEKLAAYRQAKDVVVGGIPEGGAVVAASLAVELGLPFTCVGVYKVPSPAMPDYPIAAIDEDGGATFDPHRQLTRYEMRKVGGDMLETLRRKVEACKAGTPELDLRGKTVLLVDDAVLAEWGFLAAALYLRRHGASRIVLATPVLLHGLSELASACVDEIVCLRRGRALRLTPYYAEPDLPSDGEMAACVHRAYALSKSR